MNHDLAGMRFGCLVVQSRLGVRKTPNGTRKYYWSCLCDCGNPVVRDANHLRRAGAQSCGCQRVQSLIIRNTRHGLSKHPVYLAWLHMRQRCKSDQACYKANYKDRGITVCARWSSFENFRDDMLSSWRPGLELDRRNNDGNYEPLNCRWATHQAQMYNTRRNNLITSGGVSKPIKMWADQLGGNRDLVRDRIKCGWSVDRAVSQPVRRSP